MFTVEAEIVVCYPSITYLPSELIESEWVEIVAIPQLDTDAEEYAEARTVADKLREYYKNVRITRSTLGGLREIVQECSYTFAHTRHWCGNSGCRDS